MLFDVAVLGCGALIGWFLRRFRAGRRAELRWNRLANRRTAAVLICAATAMLPRLLLLPWIPPRLPIIMDEFSYILGAQTFAAGRLTNPTPPFWQHFESFHINMVPSYQSMYPPGPSLFYAFGIVFGGNPWWGLWLSMGLMCAGICWALQPMIGARYAFLAGMVCALKYGMFSFFSDWYLGGAVAAFGGALVLGAFLRLVARDSTRNAACLIAGVALLANSRPFEGMLFCIPIGAAILTWIFRQRRWRLLITLVVTAAPVVAGMGYYNLRGTGSMMKPPYVANLAQYHYVMPFWGMPMRPRPQYHHPEMGALYDQWEGARGRISQTLSGFLSLNREKFQSYYQEHFAPILTLALVGIFASWRASMLRIPALAVVLVSCGLFCTVYRQFSAYPAPMLAGCFGLAMAGIRRLDALSIHGRRFGPYLGRGLMLALLIFGLARMVENTMKGLKAGRAEPSAWNVARARMIGDLTRSGGDHLILVKYLPGHDGHQEWVYNTPDIDAQKVIFARSMGGDADRSLMKHYAGRQAWVLEPDAGFALRPAR